MTLASHILLHSRRLNVNPHLVAAVIHQESKGDIWAVRYEPEFYKRYLQTKTKDSLGGYWSPLCSVETERRLRAHSFGAMQIMGQVARERGFKGEYLTQLCDPAINVMFGVEFLHELLEKHGSVEKALLRWNGGGDPNYPKKVLGHIDSGEFARHLVY